MACRAKKRNEVDGVRDGVFEAVAVRVVETAGVTEFGGELEGVSE